MRFFLFFRMEEKERIDKENASLYNKKNNAFRLYPAFRGTPGGI